MLSNRQIWIGIISGFVFPLLSIVLWLEIFTKYSLEKAFELIAKGSLYSEIISLAAVINMLVLWIFVYYKRDIQAKGVLLSTILLAFAVLVTKFI